MMDTIKHVYARVLSDRKLSDECSEGGSMANETLLEKPLSLHQRTSSRSRFWIPITLHGTILILYITAFLALYQSMEIEKLHGPGVIDSKVRSFI